MGKPTATFNRVEEGRKWDVDEEGRSSVFRATATDGGGLDSGQGRAKSSSRCGFGGAGCGGVAWDGRGLEERQRDGQRNERR